MKKKTWIIVAIIAVLVIAAVCAFLLQPKKPTVDASNVANIYYGGGTPLSIDPALNSASAGSNVLRLAHAGLMGTQMVDGKPTLSPELAESYTVSEDGLTYTFTLRKGLKWSDGSDFKASDVAFSWQRAAGSKLGADYGYMFEIIEGAPDNLNVVADDAAGTVTVKITARAPYFLELCGFPTFYPVKEAVVDDQGAWATKPESYIGMGAFRMTKYAVDDVISFEKNPNYWNAANVKLDGVNCLLSEDNVAMLTGYENNSAIFIDSSIDPAEYDRINTTYPNELVFGEYIGTWYVLFNVHKDVSPASKPLTVQEMSKARFAIGQLVNREELVKNVTKGGQAPATGFFPNGLGDGLNANVRATASYGSWYTGTNTPSDKNANITADQAEGLQTLIDLGYAYTGTIEGGDIKFSDFPAFDFAFNQSGANAAIIQYVQETWNKFGIPSSINTEAWATLQQKLKDGEGEAARMGWIADFNDCINFLTIFASNGGNNYVRVGKPVGTYTRASEVTKDAGVGPYWGLEGNQTWADAFDKLCDAVVAEADPAKRAELCAEGEKILMATGGVAPLYFYTHPYLIKPQVKGVMFLATGDVIWNYATIK